MAFEGGSLQMVSKPEAKEQPEKKEKRSALSAMGLSCLFKFKPGDKIIYSPDLGARATFFRWRDRALADGELVCSGGDYYLHCGAARGVETETDSQSVSVSL